MGQINNNVLHQPMGDLNSRLAYLLSNGNSQQGPTNPRMDVQTGERVDLNPLSYLGKSCKAAKYLDIIDFLADREGTSEQVIGQADGTEVIVKTTTKKVKLEQVTQIQWATANIRILVELLCRGELNSSSLLDYMAYTIKVGELADKYQ